MVSNAAIVAHLFPAAAQVLVSEPVTRNTQRAGRFNGNAKSCDNPEQKKGQNGTQAKTRKRKPGLSLEAIYCAAAWSASTGSAALRSRPIFS